MDRRNVARVLLMGVFGFMAALPSAAQGDGACEGDERHRALDFLLGEWRLVSHGETVGRSRVEKLEDGCLIAERWGFADGRSGRTYTSFDRAANLWRRFSVSNGGVMVRSSGAVQGNALLARGERATAGGEKSNWQERLALEPDGRIRLVSGGSAVPGRGDRAASAAFEGYYVPIGRPAIDSPAPDPPAEVETAEIEPPSTVDEPVEAPVEPEPVLAAAGSQTIAPTAGGVTPDSARAADAEMIERIAMASPMVLRLPLGAVEALPRGYAWITRDTAPYLCEGVTIERLEVARRQRRGQIELEVELALQAPQARKRVDVEIELVPVGRQDQGAVASGSASGRVGRSIPEQVEHGSVALKVTLVMTAEDFDAAVAGTERPELVISLAVDK